MRTNVDLRVHPDALAKHRLRGAVVKRLQRALERGHFVRPRMIGALRLPQLDMRGQMCPSAWVGPPAHGAFAEMAAGGRRYSKPSSVLAGACVDAEAGAHHGKCPRAEHECPRMDMTDALTGRKQGRSQVRVYGAHRNGSLTVCASRALHTPGRGKPPVKPAGAWSGSSSVPTARSKLQQPVSGQDLTRGDRGRLHSAALPPPVSPSNAVQCQQGWVVAAGQALCREDRVMAPRCCPGGSGNEPARRVRRFR